MTEIEIFKVCRQSLIVNQNCLSTCKVLNHQEVFSIHTLPNALQTFLPCLDDIKRSGHIFTYRVHEESVG